MPRSSARILLFSIVAATLFCIASGRRPQQSFPAPLQTMSIRSGMESPDFECRVERSSPAPDGGHPEKRIPLFGLAADGIELPIPGFRTEARRSDPPVQLSPPLLLALIRARAPPAAAC